MIVYHGSLEIVEHPQILEPNRPLDFGSGLYITTSQQQAERWVHARMDQAKAKGGFINMYEYTTAKDLRIRTFRGPNEPWVDFVHANRSIIGYHHDYDIVIGPVANDNVYLSFNLYESGIITKADLIRRLKAYKLVDQLLFHTERSLATIKCIGYKEVHK